ncbi:hypothetical protein ACWD4L_12035 [Streptomyces sp. NPDC002596]
MCWRSNRTKCGGIGTGRESLTATVLATDARSVGYANKPTKERALAEAGADAVTLSMESVADALTRLG